MENNQKSFFPSEKQNKGEILSAHMSLAVKNNRDIFKLHIF